MMSVVFLPCGPCGQFFVSRPNLYIRLLPCLHQVNIYHLHGITTFPWSSLYWLLCNKLAGQTRRLQICASHGSLMVAFDPPLLETSSTQYLYRSTISKAPNISAVRLSDLAMTKINKPLVKKLTDKYETLICGG